METLELMQQRHSVRQYKDKSIESEKRIVLNNLIAEINKKADLHIQVFYDEPKCFDSIMAHYGKFTGVKNYIALVGKKSAHLDEKLGFYGEEIVIKAQALGLNTCYVAMTHGKSKAEVRKGEKQVCLIALGYGCTNGVPHKSKPIEEVSNATPSSPIWFINAMNAVLLAPTALNQQKFFFKLEEDGKVTASRKAGFYTKIDLGIAKYHFDAATKGKLEASL